VSRKLRFINYRSDGHKNAQQNLTFLTELILENSASESLALQEKHPDSTKVEDPELGVDQLHDKRKVNLVMIATTFSNGVM